MYYFGGDLQMRETIPDYKPEPPAWDDFIPYCPVCGEETDTYYKDKDGVIVGCDSCIVPVEPWEVEDG